MRKPQNACCPECAAPISFRKFVVLNNLSATQCDKCKTRIEIANRNTNAVIAGISGCLSAASIALSAYVGLKNYGSLLGGIAAGTGIAVLIIVFICWYAYTHARLNCLRHFLHTLDYPGKDLAIAHAPDPLLVGRADQLDRDELARPHATPPLPRQVEASESAPAA